MTTTEPSTAPRRRLVLFAHGSRDRHWLETCERIARRVGDSLGEDAVALAYMQMAEPTLDQVVARAARDGVNRLTVLPLFFSAGGHVAKDIPRIVAAARRSHPDFQIDVREPVGEDDRFAELVVALSEESLTHG